MKIPRSFVGLFLLASAACAAPTSEGEELQEDALTGGTAGSSDADLPCAIRDFRGDTHTTPLPRTDQVRASIQATIDAANEAEEVKGSSKRYTLEDFGPYELQTFTMKVNAEHDVDASLAFVHTLPSGRSIPRQVPWTGRLPAGAAVPVTIENYYDPITNGEADRHGRHKGTIALACDGKTATQRYTFVR